MSSSDPTTERMQYDPRYLLLGEILRPHGIRGELRMRILTDYPERIPKLKAVYIGSGIDADDIVAYSVEHMRIHQNYGLLKVAGVDNRNQAEDFRALFVMIDIENAVPLEEGEFYLYQLLGVNIQTEDGQSLGPIIEVIETGANDVYVVDSEDYGEVLIPVTDETIVSTDVDAGVIVVRLPEGLLPSA